MHVRCSSCRYDLVGLVNGTRPVRCPECGHEGAPFSPPTRRQVWNAIALSLGAATLPWSVPFALGMFLVSSDSSRSSLMWSFLPTIFAALAGVIVLMTLVARRSPVGGQRAVVACHVLGALLQLPCFTFFMLFGEAIRGIDS